MDRDSQKFENPWSIVLLVRIVVLLMWSRQKLSTRIKEHKNNVKSNQSKHSVISNDIIRDNHSMDWRNVRVDCESNYNKTHF